MCDVCGREEVDERGEGEVEGGGVDGGFEGVQGDGAVEAEGEARGGGDCGEKVPNLPGLGEINSRHITLHAINHGHFWVSFRYGFWIKTPSRFYVHKLIQFSSRQ